MVLLFFLQRIRLCERLEFRSNVGKKNVTEHPNGSRNAKQNWNSNQTNIYTINKKNLAYMEKKKIVRDGYMYKLKWRYFHFIYQFIYMIIHTLHRHYTTFTIRIFTLYSIYQIVVVLFRWTLEKNKIK